MPFGQHIRKKGLFLAPAQRPLFGAVRSVPQPDFLQPRATPATRLFPFFDLFDLFQFLSLSPEDQTQ